MTMMALGQFVFSLDTLAYQELQRSTDWRHPSNSRVGARPARQFVGVGEDTITLTGLVVPEFRGSRKTLDQIRAMADAGSAYALVAGTGDVMGAWVNQRVNETGTLFIREGVARRVDFTLELARVDDDQADPAGGASTGGDPWADDSDFWDWWL